MSHEKTRQSSGSAPGTLGFVSPREGCGGPIDPGELPRRIRDRRRDETKLVAWLNTVATCFTAAERTLVAPERRETRGGRRVREWSEWCAAARRRTRRLPCRGRRLHGRRPIGVVKREKGTGRMPRRHQMAGVVAAISSGERPKTRRSRDTRRRPGELKHLSTRRKRNQPRLPQ